MVSAQDVDDVGLGRDVSQATACRTSALINVFARSRRASTSPRSLISSINCRNSWLDLAWAWWTASRQGHRTLLLAHRLTAERARTVLTVGCRPADLTLAACGGSSDSLRSPEGR